MLLGWTKPGSLYALDCLWKENGGFWSFKLGKSLSAQSLMSHGRHLDNNAASGAGDRGLAVTFQRGV